jgi:hypothetical protein
MKRIVLILFLTIYNVHAFSQQRGVELSHYLFPGFVQGTVLMQSGQQYKAMLNYNTLSEEMIFDSKGRKLAIGNEERDKIDTVYILNRKFFVMDNRFVELVYSAGYGLYAEHRCDVKYPGKPAAYGGTSETSSISTYSGIYSGGTFYELKLPDGFTIRPYTVYWLKINEENKKFVSLKQLIRLFGDRKDEIREYLGSHKVDYNDRESVVSLIRYLEANRQD